MLELKSPAKADPLQPTESLAATLETELALTGRDTWSRAGAIRVQVADSDAQQVRQKFEGGRAVPAGRSGG